ncbi:hypothetical protein [Evansella cellulosilytica]|uniref:Uncharacterized protein n=1 Tax=Evansella cellulosilytica (strain ATCC 21833 / DSM 2522 / FERM P-1141 / JCM 9156 / N-4) TaxID=649639 RepID=E6TVU3_EVAC2|nr:hypothetical protein [Evansella cellulosilytica]ADU28652.1 hypothetical protein Bcell_0366 [Evansella cellulosilytica DSM 2522]
MPMWFTVTLVIAIVLLFVYSIFYKKKKSQTLKAESAANNKICKTCQTSIPQEHDKSLCPNCKTILT